MRIISLVAAWFGLCALAVLAQTNITEFGKGAARPGEGVGTPVPLSRVEPKYTRTAERAKIEGTVDLEAVVQVDGTIGDVRVLRSLDALYGLDEQAIRCVRQWRFNPGLKDGRPVPVLMTIPVEFRLKDGHAASLADEEDFLAGASEEGEPGLVMPKLIGRVEPTYPPRAMGARISGRVVLEAVIMPDGTVGRLRLVRSLDEEAKYGGFDQAAAIAARQWRFEPGRKNGFPVPVVVKIMCDFRMREDPTW